MKNRKICIVGYGPHVENTIIPSLNIGIKKNLKIITKKKINNFETFTNIKIALKKLTKDYIFYNATPPKFHYPITKLILSSGFNVMTEKPLCLNVNQLERLNNIAKKKKLFMVENMMYFHSQQFKLLNKLLNKKNINKVNIKFSIPDLNKKSFRMENDIDSSILYDMGCYPFSLISFFNFDNNSYKVSYKIKDKKISFIKILFTSKQIKFSITIEIFKKYENYVKINFKDNIFYILNHFFYGKKIKKTNYIYKLNKKIKTVKIDEENLFKIIFGYSNQKLFMLSRAQFLTIKKYLICLNQIKKHIKL